jgi:hypothetical protein
LQNGLEQVTCHDVRKLRLAYLDSFSLLLNFSHPMRHLVGQTTKLDVQTKQVKRLASLSYCTMKNFYAVGARYDIAWPDASGGFRFLFSWLSRKTSKTHFATVYCLLLGGMRRGSGDDRK